MKHYLESSERPVDVYPVGFLRDALQVWRAFRLRRQLPPGVVKSEARKYARWFRRSWRRKSYWNGYLAEPTWPGDQSPQWRRCGSGWTKRRALRSLSRHTFWDFT